MNSQLSKNNEHAASGGAGSLLCVRPPQKSSFIFLSLNGLAQALTITVTLRANTEQGDPELKPAFPGNEKIQIKQIVIVMPFPFVIKAKA